MLHQPSVIPFCAFHWGVFGFLITHDFYLLLVVPHYDSFHFIFIQNVGVVKARFIPFWCDFQYHSVQSLHFVDILLQC